MLPKLEELIAGKTVLVLGAGASMEYGFPSWDGLGTELINRLASIHLESTDQHDKKMASMWKNAIEKADFKTTTIDHVIAENYGTLVERHWIVQCIKNIISEKEEIDSQEPEQPDRWVERFSEKFISILEVERAKKSVDDVKALSVLDGLVVVSLNYERCFAHYFYPKIREYFNSARFEDKDFLRNQRKQLIRFFSIYQPHGSLGFMSIPGINRIGNPVTSVKIFDGNKHTEFRDSSSGSPYGSKSNQHGHIELVGEGSMEENYKRINNSAIQGAKYCLVIGLSEAGLDGCKVNWDSFDHVFYSGQSVSEHLKKKFVCLDMRADAISSALCAE